MAESQKKLTQKELDHFKAIILKKREELLIELGVLEDFTIKEMRDGTSVDSSYAYHMADAGTDAQEREKAYLWLARENKYLQHLNNALKRIESGDYGFCIECGEKIPRERLEEVPHTRHCVKCKNKKT